MSDDSKYEWGGYSEINVDSVDLEVFPKIKDVHYSKVTLNKGDCIFMPGGETHIRERETFRKTISKHSITVS